MTRTGRTLRSRRNFRLMWAGESVSFFGSQLTEFAMPLIAVSVLHVDNTFIPFLALAAGIGTVLTLVFLAPLADHPSRKRVMILVNVVRIAAMVGLALSLATNQHPFAVMCVVGFVTAGCSGVYDSTFAGLVTEAVEPAGLQRANSWFSGMRSAGNIGAGGVGGLLLQSVTAPVVALLDALTYAVAIVALLGVRSIPSNAPSPTGSRGFTAGIRALWRDPVQRSITAALAHFNIFTTAIQSILVLFAVRTLGLNALEIGAAMMIGGAIGLSGVVLARPVLRTLTLGNALIVTLAAPGLLAAGLWFVAPADGGVQAVAALAAIAVLTGAWSVSVIINITATETYKQATVDRGIIGRFSSAVRLVTWGVDPLGAVLAVALLSVWDLRTTMLILSIGLAASSAWILSSRRVRSLPRLQIVTSAAQAETETAGVV